MSTVSSSSCRSNSYLPRSTPPSLSSSSICLVSHSVGRALEAGHATHLPSLMTCHFSPLLACRRSPAQYQAGYRWGDREATTGASTNCSQHHDVYLRPHVGGRYCVRPPPGGLRAQSSMDNHCPAFMQKNPDMFKVSTNCKLPHVNIDNIRNDLYQVGGLSQAVDLAGSMGD